MPERHRGLSEEPSVFGPKAPGTTREVQSSVAKTHLPQLLDEVERGVTIVITRHGHPVARLVPDEEGQRTRVVEALEAIKKLGRRIRQEHGPTTLEEILAWRHEGHKY